MVPPSSSHVYTDATYNMNILFPSSPLLKISTKRNEDNNAKIRLKIHSFSARQAAEMSIFEVSSTLCPTNCSPQIKA